VPIARSRAASFDEIATAVVARLDRRLGDALTNVQFLVRDVPDLDGWDRDWVPLGSGTPAEGGVPPRVVLYRRPIETRADGTLALRRLVFEVLVEQVADALGVDPADVDPRYHGEED
jgi:hypothetical protein